MKLKHIIILVVIAVGIAMILSTYTDASTTANFREASEQPEKTFHVKTTLIKTKTIDYDPVKDPELFTFYAEDAEGQTRQVICYKEKPRDFELSEEVVLIGKIKDDHTFVATDLQTKCPSKYENEVEDIEEI
ncbi:MAG: cytochrome c maturation protein CcmE [Bacteroidetes bacterium]|nr:cytochrome c maturation protein CcmE [Bacteroidota bacterium]